MWFTISPSAQHATGKGIVSTFRGGHPIMWMFTFHSPRFLETRPCNRKFWDANICHIDYWRSIFGLDLQDYFFCMQTAAGLQAWCHVARDSESLEGWLFEYRCTVWLVKLATCNDKVNTRFLQFRQCQKIRDHYVFWLLERLQNPRTACNWIWIEGCLNTFIAIIQIIIRYLH